MIQHRFATRRSREATPASAVVGMPLAAVWALHAAGTTLPNQMYFMIPLLLASVVALLVWRLGSRQCHFHFAHKPGLAIALTLWLVGATFSLIPNWNTSQVVLDYVTVFACGTAVFIALSGVVPTPGRVDVAVVGLVVGALFPLIKGLQAFVSEWGVPDFMTAVSAYQSPLRMTSYEAATFGSRGNTASLVVILVPLLLSILLDGRKLRAMRIFCAATLVPIVLSLLILQVRAAFITLLVMLAVVWTFRFGARRLPPLALAITIGWILVARFDPDLEWMVSRRYVPVITADADADTSVAFRLEAMAEGWQLFQKNWLVGIGPGAALTRHSLTSAHQFQVQQAMETGLLGLIGSTLLTLVVWASMTRTVVRPRDETNDLRFVLLVGPTSYLVYAVIGNATLATGTLNIWSVLLASMLALAPPIDVRRRVAQSQVWRRDMFAEDVCRAGGRGIGAAVNVEAGARQ